MQRQEQTNTFQDGIISDTHPLSTTNTAMTDALNATIVTYNGNEMILQNDMGNARLYVDDEQDSYVQLTSGFKPLGVKEHGGILYIASTDGKQFELGSFPGPMFSNIDKSIKYALKPEEIGSSSFSTDEYDNVLPNLSGGEIGKIIENSNLYKNIPLVIKNEENEENEENCILKVGQEYNIRVLTNGDNQISEFGVKRMYKVKFVNLENDKDITEDIKRAITYQGDSTPSSCYYYFPNIANVKLGVSFEFEDIELFDLGQTAKLKNDKQNVPLSDKMFETDLKTGKPKLDPEYNGSRYPQLTNDFEVIFQTIEYKTNSEIKVSHFYIEWELISKIERNFTEDEKENLLKGYFYGKLGNAINDTNIYKLSYSDKIGGMDNDENMCMIALPYGDKKYRLKYKIYPIWEQYSVFDCVNKDDPEKYIINLHNDYIKTFSKNIIFGDIDLELSPSLWGSRAEYTELSEFNQDRYLSADYYFRDLENFDEIEIPLKYEGNFYYIEPNGSPFNINDSKTKDSFQYIKCLNPLGKIEQVFKNIKNMSTYHPIQGFIQLDEYDYPALSLYYGVAKVWDIFNKPTDYYKPNGYDEDLRKLDEYQDGPYKTYCYGKLKKCRVHNFKHYNTISKSTDCFENTTYFNLKKVKLEDHTNYEINAQKMATRLVVADSWDWKKLPHIEYGKQGFSPLCQQPILNIQSSEYSYDNGLFETWKILPVPGGGSPFNDKYVSNLKNRLSSFFGYSGDYNNNDILDTEFNTGIEPYKNDKIRELNIKDGEINLNIQNNIFALFAKNDSDEKKCLNEEDINQEYSNQEVSNFLDNSKIVYDYYNTEERITNQDFSDNKDIKSYHGAYVSWYYNFNTDGTKIILPNNLNQKIQLALTKTRTKDDEVIFLDSFGNISSKPNITTKYPVSDITIFNKENNKSKFNKDNSTQLQILAPYTINCPEAGSNFVSLWYGGTISQSQQEFTYNFKDITSDYVNIRFYITRMGNPNDLLINVKGLQDFKLCIQGQYSDSDEIGPNENLFTIHTNKINELQYYLVQLIGKVDDSNISITVSKKEDYDGWYIRNVTAYAQTSSEPLQTFAITTYSSNKTLCKVNNFKFREEKIYCYLPEPNYFIDQVNPTFEVDDEGYTEIENSLKVKIIN